MLKASPGRFCSIIMWQWKLLHYKIETEKEIEVWVFSVISKTSMMVIIFDLTPLYTCSCSGTQWLVRWSSLLTSIFTRQRKFSIKVQLRSDFLQRSKLGLVALFFWDRSTLFHWLLNHSRPALNYQCWLERTWGTRDPPEEKRKAISWSTASVNAVSFLITL